jgi:hypothetical protein
MVAKRRRMFFAMLRVSLAAWLMMAPGDQSLAAD